MIIVKQESLLGQICLKSAGINLIRNFETKLEAQHWAEPVSLTFHSALSKLNTEPSIGASHQISAHFGQAVSEKKIFRNRPI